MDFFFDAFTCYSDSTVWMLQQATNSAPDIYLFICVLSIFFFLRLPALRQCFIVLLCFAV